MGPAADFFVTDGDSSLRLLHFPFYIAVTSFSVKDSCSVEATSITKSAGMIQAQGCAMVDGLPIGQNIQLVKLLKYPATK
jgi:hypothetical protein